MDKDKLKKLNVYKTLIQDKMSAPLPEKHKNRAKEYKAFLTKELEDVTSKIDKMKA